MKPDKTSGKSITFRKLQEEEKPDYPGIIPGECSALSPQSKNKNRVSVFVNGEFIAGFYQQIILDFKLTIGATVTQQMLSAMKVSEQKYVIKERCFDWLGRRAHSRNELKQKALKKKFSKTVIEEVLNELDQKGYLDDQAFAILFAGDKAKIYGWGPQKIRSALYQKGLEKRYIESALDEALTEDELLENLYKAVNKGKGKFLRIDDPFKRKKKLVDFLRRKGYTLEVILAEVESLLKIIDDEKP